MLDCKMYILLGSMEAAASRSHVGTRAGPNAVLNHCYNAAELKAAKASAWPAEKTIYDWCYSHDTGGWVDWMATVPPFTPDPDASFSQIIVPTSDTVCYNYLLRSLVAAGKHVLYVGETGTGSHICLARATLEKKTSQACQLHRLLSVEAAMQAAPQCCKNMYQQSCPFHVP